MLFVGLRHARGGERGVDDAIGRSGGEWKVESNWCETHCRRMEFRCDSEGSGMRLQIEGDSLLERGEVIRSMGSY